MLASVTASFPEQVLVGFQMIHYEEILKTVTSFDTATHELVTERFLIPPVTADSTERGVQLFFTPSLTCF